MIGSICFLVGVLLGFFIADEELQDKAKAKIDKLIEKVKAKF